MKQQVAKVGDRYLVYDSRPVWPFDLEMALQLGNIKDIGYFATHVFI